MAEAEKGVSAATKRSHHYSSSSQSSERTSKNCCVAFGCSNYPRKCPEKSFHSFPTAADRKDAWIKAVRREQWTPSKSSVLCSDHFTSESYQVSPGIGKKARLKANTIPTLEFVF
ncbi:THAP domain-containing protein 2-like [Watersipora subatra]|uniref:THAP domain-containing protein 2-like n=1 Tax=Watersipora subatra TaxID=2589382 RepID=UPI00355B48AE